MLFRQVLYQDLGCASYLLGDAGEAIVVDPRWDIAPYLEIAESEHLRIAHVIDTHDHADHVSGRLRLARATGARSYRPGAREDGVGDTVAAGDEIIVGSVCLTAVASPGHRPEHLTFLVSDLSRGPEPWMLLSGDSLLVGDVARPDLAVEAHEGAYLLHASLQRLLDLEDHVEVWPAHIGGSLCGGSGLSRKSSSTVGFERRHNALLGLSEADFVDGVTSHLPSRPPNITRIVELNRRAGGALPPETASLSGDALLSLLGTGAVVLDSRVPAEFDRGHVAGSINLPVSSAGVGTRAGWALDPEAPVVIVAGDEADASRMASALQAVGFWNLEGVAIADVEGWRRHSVPVARADSWDLEQLADGLRHRSVDLVDVREPAEWVAGHIPGSHHVPLNRLRDVQSIVLPQRGRTTAVACAAGIRAAFAASLLRRAGRADVVRVAGGGIGDLGAHGLELAAGD
ncbi:MAG TPA: MBL fold metallo-hydrolase [Solirubrobacteraceae bacterium]|nr:MBL fold metallo-hydrolase [Solirubrobacteraceae bacterium]